MKKITLTLSLLLCCFSLFSEEHFRGTVLTEKLRVSDLPPLKPNQCRIILLRHAETDWNVSGKPQGWKDIPLNEKGRNEARELSEKFADIDIKHVYTSALSRAVETAEILAAPHKAIVTADPLLRFYKKNKDWLDVFRTKSEKKTKMRREIKEGSLAYLKDLVQKYPGETVLVVTHGRVVKTVFSALGKELNSRVKIKNGAMAYVIGDSDSLSLESF